MFLPALFGQKRNVCFSSPRFLPRRKRNFALRKSFFSSHFDSVRGRIYRAFLRVRTNAFRFRRIRRGKRVAFIHPLCTVRRRHFARSFRNDDGLRDPLAKSSAPFFGAFVLSCDLRRTVRAVPTAFLPFPCGNKTAAVCRRKTDSSSCFRSNLLFACTRSRHVRTRF